MGREIDPRIEKVCAALLQEVDRLREFIDDDERLIEVMENLLDIPGLRISPAMETSLFRLTLDNQLDFRLKKKLIAVGVAQPGRLPSINGNHEAVVAAQVLVKLYTHVDEDFQPRNECFCDLVQLINTNPHWMCDAFRDCVIQELAKFNPNRFALALFYPLSFDPRINCPPLWNAWQTCIKLRMFNPQQLRETLDVSLLYDHGGEEHVLNQVRGRYLEPLLHEFARAQIKDNSTILAFIQLIQHLYGQEASHCILEPVLIILQKLDFMKLTHDQAQGLIRWMLNTKGVRDLKLVLSLNFIDVYSKLLLQLELPAILHYLLELHQHDNFKDLCASSEVAIGRALALLCATENSEYQYRLIRLLFFINPAILQRPTIRLILVDASHYWNSFSHLAVLAHILEPEAFCQKAKQILQSEPSQAPSTKRMIHYPDPEIASKINHSIIQYIQGPFLYDHAFLIDIALLAQAPGFSMSVVDCDLLAICEAYLQKPTGCPPEAEMSPRLLMQCLQVFLKDPDVREDPRAARLIRTCTQKV